MAKGRSHEKLEARLGYRFADPDLLDRALTAQGLISGPSVMHPKLRFTPELAKQIETRRRKKALVPVTIGDDQALDDLVQSLWLIGDFWLVFRDAGGTPFAETDIEQGVRLFRRLIAPYLKGAST